MIDNKILSDMFALGLPWLEKILRPIFIYIFLVIGLRLAGKRELAQLNPFDLVVLLTLSNTVQNAIIGDDNSVTGAIIGASSLLAVNYVTVRLLYGHGKVEAIIEGAPDPLIEQGHINTERLARELITVPELEMAAHKQGIGSLGEVERAVLEPGGTITFIMKKPEPDVERHQELLARMDAITRELAALRSGATAN